jgi:HlyD family secretion protein
MKTVNKKIRAGLMLGVLIPAIALAACQAAAPVTTSTGAAQQSNAVQTGNIITGTNSTQQGGLTGNLPAGAAMALPTALPTRAVTAQSSIAVDGALALSAPLVTAAFESSGNVTAVNVKPGQSVKKGDVLATLDATDLNTALQQAEEKLALKQAEIAKSLAPATAAEIKSAKAALSSAYAAYNALKAGPTASDIELALRTYNQAKNSLYAQQLQRDQVCHFVPGSPDPVNEANMKKDPDCKQSDLSVQAAELRLQNAKQTYDDAQLPATQEKLAQAWASVVQAQSNLTSLQKGATDEQKKVYDLQLQQAQLTVDRARRDLAQAQLISPCDCVAQDVALTAGAPASGGITLLNPSQLKFQTSNLNERDVVKLQAGQAVSLRLKAFDQTFSGIVESILPISSGATSDVALYTAIIKLDSTDAALLPGMTGQADILLK